MRGDRPLARCSAAGSSRCRRCSSPCRATCTSARRAPPADRPRCPRSGRRPTPSVVETSPYTSLDGAHLRQHLSAGCRSNLSSSSSHSQRVDVEQHRARRVGHIGDVRRAARELPDQPAVDRAERQLPGFRLSRARPARCRGSTRILLAGKIRVDDQAGAFADELLVARPASVDRRSPAVRRSCQTIAL